MSEWFRDYGYARVGDGLWVGAYPTDAGDVAEVAELGVERALNLCEDDEYRAGEREAVVEALAEAGIEEERVPLVDYGGLSRSTLEEAVEAVRSWLDDGEAVYLHCRAGWQRSAAVAAGVLALREDVDAEEALERLAGRKPTAEPLPHQRRDLLAWWAEREA
ncbi:MAG TPA: dual specificity protein phosphatase family protein [Solirubrobacteraceae bacterium]